MTRPSALLLAKSGYIIRDILLGKFTDELLRHMDLVVAVPDPEDEGLRQFAEGRPIAYIPFHRTPTPETHYERFLSAKHWMYRFKQIERENRSLEIITRLYEPNLSGKKARLVRFTLWAGRLVNRLQLMGPAERLFLAMVRRWRVTRRWAETLAEIRPAVVVSTALTLPEGFFAPSVDLPVALAAREQAVPCGTLIQSWDNLSSKTYVLPPWLDRFWTWSEKMNEELVTFNPRVDRKRARVVGSPHFDFHRDSRLELPRSDFVRRVGLDPDRPYALIGTGTRKLLPDEPKTVIRLVARLRERNPALQILLRVHPKDVASRWPGHFANLRSMGVVIQQPIPDKPMDSGGFTLPELFFREQINTIRHAAVVINTASSLTVDAAILDRPVISLGYDLDVDEVFPEGRSRFYNRSAHFGPLAETGGVWVAESEEACVEAIHAYLENPDLHREGRCQIARMVGGALDGRAGVRLAQEVVCLA